MCADVPGLLLVDLVLPAENVRVQEVLKDLSFPTGALERNEKQRRELLGKNGFGSRRFPHSKVI